MQIIIHSQNTDVTPAIREYIEKKLNKLSRYFDHIVDVEVHTSTQRSFKTAEVTLNARGKLIRAEEKNSDLKVAIDQVAEKLEKQIKHYKGRMVDRQRRPQRQAHLPATSTELETSRSQPAYDDATESEDLSWPRIVRRKKFPVETMSAEEAAERMQMLGHNFYLFQDEQTRQLSLVYERLDGDFGVLEPEAPSGDL